MLDLAPSLLTDVDRTDAASLWAGSAVRDLTGRRGGRPAEGPLGLLPMMRGLAARLEALGGPAVDGPDLLVERARITGHHRQGAVSVGGACRLVRASDGWLAVSLARDEDVASVPAWLEADVDGVDVLAVDAVAAARPVSELVERAGLLGIPCGALGEVQRGRLPALALEESACRSPIGRGVRGMTVLDLSSLWAGPLCGRLLAAVGAHVIKVESASRPDGARRGPKQFFDVMNGAKESVVLNFGSPSGRAELAALVDSADVVIEASRPRALQQLGIDAMRFTGSVWLSITAYGRLQPMRVGFGDDCAVAGGLVAWDDAGPLFVADAAADPISGLLGAVAVLDRVAAGGTWLVDLGLAHAAALAC